MMSGSVRGMSWWWIPVVWLCKHEFFTFNQAVAKTNRQTKKSTICVKIRASVLCNNFFITLSPIILNQFIHRGVCGEGFWGCDPHKILVSLQNLKMYFSAFYNQNVLATWHLRAQITAHLEAGCNTSSPAHTHTCHGDSLSSPNDMACENKCLLTVNSDWKKVIWHLWLYHCVLRVPEACQMFFFAFVKNTRDCL